MRKIIFSVLIVLFTASLLFARMSIMSICGPVAEVASCETSFQTGGSANNSDRNLGRYSNDIWVGTDFVASESSTICKVDVRLKKTGTPTGNITLRIFADNSDTFEGGAVLGTSTTTIDVSTLTTSYQTITFEGLNVPLTATTVYWVVLNGDFADPNYANAEYDSNIAARDVMYCSDSAGSPSSCANYGATNQLMFTLYK